MGGCGRRGRDFDVEVEGDTLVVEVRRERVQGGEGKPRWVEKNGFSGGGGREKGCGRGMAQGVPRGILAVLKYAPCVQTEAGVEPPGRPRLPLMLLYFVSVCLLQAV